MERVFWHTLFDPPSGVPLPRGAMATHSLLRRQHDGQLGDKPAADAFRELAALLEDLPRSAITAIDVEGGHGVALGDRGWLVEGRVVRVPSDAREARRLVGGDGVTLSRVGSVVEVDASAGAVFVSR